MSDEPSESDAPFARLGGEAVVHAPTETGASALVIAPAPGGASLTLRGRF